MTKHYAERDLLEMDRAGDFYGNHVMAMTAEQLHSISDIAAELGWRDMQIANLKEQLTATTNSLTNAQEALKSAGIEADTVQAGVMELKAQRDALAAENAALKTFIKQSCYSYDGDGSDVCASYVGADESPFFPKTPATDAYLNAVRADVIVEAASRIAAQAWEEDEGPGFVAAVDALEIIEREFRAGNAGKDGSHE